MNTRQMFTGMLLYLFILFVSDCAPEEIILHGNLAGTVTDARTSVPIQDASVNLEGSEYTSRTGSDGSYLLNKIDPGDHTLLASKYRYAGEEKYVKVRSAETTKVDFALDPVPTIVVSDTLLEYGFDTTRLSFTISNEGTDQFTYVITTDSEWITVSPASGVITDNTDTIVVTADRTGLTTSTYSGTIKITATSPQRTDDTFVDLYLNRISWGGEFYKAVQIGTQTWMAENLNVGSTIPTAKDQTDNGIIEKYCYEGDCETYGGLYTWDEAMDYNSFDNGIVGTTQGICPEGWHIPTIPEWDTLFHFLTPDEGGKMKEKETVHWKHPNTGATNESGFTALPAGYFDIRTRTIDLVGETTYWWSTTETAMDNGIQQVWGPSIDWDMTVTQNNQMWITVGASVRCLKNIPGK